MAFALPSLPARRVAARPGQILAVTLIALFLAIFLVIPAGTVIYTAFTEKGTGALTAVNFIDFFRTDLFRRSFFNSV